jgi:hypothetical protein
MTLNRVFGTDKEGTFGERKDTQVYKLVLVEGRDFVEVYVFLGFVST